MLTEERVEAIFKEMDQLVIELQSDPSCLGPEYFQDLIATCRNYLNRVGLVLNELNRERLAVSSEVRRLEALYELEHDELLANDQTVKELGASIEDRKAAVGWRLRHQRAALNDAKARQHGLNAVHKVVAFRNKELHATMAAIRDQKRLVLSEIRSGSFYGDERPVSRPGEDDGGGVSAEDLAAIFADAPTENVVASDANVAPVSVEPAEQSLDDRAAAPADATETHALDDLFESI